VDCGAVRRPAGMRRDDDVRRQPSCTHPVISAVNWRRGAARRGARWENAQAAEQSQAVSDGSLDPNDVWARRRMATVDQWSSDCGDS
jgi:hypothetical protein